MPVFAVRAPAGAVRVPDVAAGTGIKIIKADEAGCGGTGREEMY